MRRLALVSTTWLLACFSEPGGMGGAPDDAGTSTATTDVAPDPSVGTEGGSSSDSGTSECDPTAIAEGVFVSADGGDDVGGDGTAERPVATIGTAITIALATEQRTIYLDEGNYSDAVVLPDAPLGLVIEGGWIRVGTQWSIDCSDDVAERTVISSMSSFVIEANGVVHPSALRRLTIATKAAGASPPDESGESIYGVRVIGDDSVLALDDVIVIAGRGGDGGTASEGVLGMPAPPPDDDRACDGLACDDGAAGTSAALPGAPATTAGAFVDTGFVPRDGEPGDAGDAGRAGTASPMGPDSANDCVAGCSCTNNSCGADGPLVVSSGAPGRCGCGGGAGGGGGAGRGGGATVALFVSGANATVSLSRARLSTDRGGDGSIGAAGGAGGAGSEGVVGEATACFTGCATGGGPCANCYAANEKLLDGGAAGGVGGSGGSGSAGGAGAGGDAWTIVLVGGAKLITNDDVTLAHGEAGNGAAQAPDGVAGELLALE